ncbi:E3 ubiquitin/ISG15 ligase TRIM25-like [Sinocyclocheilus grahami]|uniref:E3 ubiquitin/ISG15 ligase TRIM25-like n=1 Tax=Sinocyclocheilus grahami TaxID=75366 RepID=UPI0007AD311C|nr:PREDICTED: E3 ubiquitin/ISG15 ligase TRIM25-like [Sinocyclocheilus grahami]
MAEANVSVGQDQFTCSVCLDLLKNPVTIPCGHSYCMNCITGWWNQENQRGLYKCPQCRKIFSPRPALCKNVVFDQLVENLKKTKLQTAVPAGASCQTPFDRHEEFCSNKPNKVMDTTGRQQQKICPQHNKQLEIYCRTDQLYICYLCAVNTHKTHNTVTAIDERTEKQKHLEQTQRDFQERIQQREKDLQELREVVKTHKHSAEKAVQDTERNFTELIHSIERSHSEITQLIRDQEKAAVSQTEILMKQLEQEIDDMRRRDTELEQLLQTDDHIHFLLSFESCSVPPQTTDVPRITANSHLLYDDVGKSVLLLKNKLEEVCKELTEMISNRVQNIKIISTSDESIKSPQPRSRATIPGLPPGFPPTPLPRRGPIEFSRYRSLSDSKYWHFIE